MRNAQFDNKLKDVLENIEVPYEPASWDAFQQRLDQPTRPDGEAIDNALRRPLANLEAPYQPATWNMLAKRLDAIEQVRKIRWAKIAEAAILLLLVVNLQQIMQGTTWFHMPAGSEQTASEAPMAARAQRQHSASNRNTLAANEAIDNTVVVPQNIDNQTDQTTLANIAYDLSPLRFMEMLLFNNSENTSVLTNNNTNTATIGNRSSKNMPPLSLLAALGLGPVQLQQPAPATMGAAIVVPGTTSPMAQANPASSNTYLSLYTQIDRDHTQTIEPGFSDTRTGYSVGVHAGVKKGKWGAEAGLAYRHQGYRTPVQVGNLYENPNGAGYVATSLDAVSGNLIGVPVKVTRQMVRLGRTKASVTAGATAQVAATKKYQYRDYQYATLPPSQPQPHPVADNQPLGSGKGWMEGGSFADNFAVTAELGLRIEHQVSSHLTAYIEPIVRRKVAGNGYGPQKTQTNSIGVQAGVITML